jgi:hypothetical protein
MMTRKEAHEFMAQKEFETMGKHKWGCHRTFQLWVEELVNKIYGDGEHKQETSMTKDQLQIAELQSLCARTLGVLEEEKFFEKTIDGETGYYTLHRDLEKARDGKEFKMFIEIIKVLEGEDD